MRTPFRLPDVGEGLTEADLISWRVTVGDEINVNDPIADIETAKSVVEMPSPVAGTVAELLVEAGDTVQVGTTIIEFETESAADDAPSDDNSSTDSSGGATLVGYGDSEKRSRRRRRRSTPAHTDQADHADPADRADRATQKQDSGTVTLAKPPVRKLAKDLGIDLHQVPATGSIGQVTRDDVTTYAERSTQSQDTEPRTAAADSTTEAPTIIPLKGVRKATAEAMVSSAFTAPHITEFLDVDVTKTVELVQQWRHDDVAAEGVKISALTVLGRAVCWAVARRPELNARLDGDQIVVNHHVNLGIAAATERGLIVPTIKNAHRLGVVALAEEITTLTERARQGTTTPEEMADGTITITNVGVFGVDSGTPILNPGQSAIVAFGQIRRRPWVVGDDLAVRDVTTLSVSADHRVVDGAEVSMFLADLGRALEDPQTLLL